MSLPDLVSAVAPADPLNVMFSHAQLLIDLHTHRVNTDKHTAYMTLKIKDTHLQGHRTVYMGHSINKYTRLRVIATCLPMYDFMLLISKESNSHLQDMAPELNKFQPQR